MNPIVAIPCAIAGYMLGRRALKEAVSRAHRDHLTGLPDRSVMEPALRRAMSHGKNVTVGVLDINKLKSFNDEFGHAAGDSIIKMVANQLNDVVKQLDHGMNTTAARIGGDEFVVITEATPEDLERAYMHTMWDGSERDFASLGIARLHEGEPIDHVLACADVAMYYAKNHSTPVLEYDPEIMVDPDKERPAHVRRNAR